VIDDLFSLEGRIAVVTGGGRGIGKMIAGGFVARGAKVYITSRSVDECQATAEELGSACIAAPGDISSQEGIDRLVARVKDSEGKLDLLVNNAGAAWGAPFAEYPQHGWDKVMALNVRSPFFLVQAFHPLLCANATADNPSKVINVSSIDGLRISANETYAYQASKAALNHLTRTLAARLINDHIVVNCIAPGAFPTKINRAVREKGDELADIIPAKRVGRPDDIVGPVVFLASKAGDYVAGETLAVDGGLTYASYDAFNLAALEV
jgi:NAD(P)-dependent dehydrogenase (short-subunit alcohol dehydrogenase family)